jgi:hypothetical protein
MKKPVCVPSAFVPYVSTRPFGVITAWTAIKGQSVRGPQRPSTFGWADAPVVAKAAVAATPTNANVRARDCREFRTVEVVVGT